MPHGSTTSPGPGDLLVGLSRAFGGAVVFALPLFMTMEMWALGLYMDRLRLALLLALMLPLLVGLSHFGGFKETASWAEDVADALIAYGVALVAAAAVLALLSVVGPDTPAREAVGKVALQAVPGALGAMLARSQFGGGGEGARGYGSEVLVMTAGALFLALNVAPTEEVVLLAYMATPWHALALVAASLGATHAFVYAADFPGGHDRPEGTPLWSEFLRLTVVGYAVALLVSAYVLWTFGRFEGGAYGACALMAVVLGFPAAVGAAAARLIL